MAHLSNIDKLKIHEMSKDKHLQINSNGWPSVVDSTFRKAFIEGLSGAISSFICTLLFYPLENLRTRLQLRKNKAASGKSRLDQKELKEENPEHLGPHIKDELTIESLYRGLRSAILAQMVSQTIYFWWYRFLTDVFYSQSESNPLRSHPSTS